MTSEGYRVSFWLKENVALDGGDVCMTMNILY